MCYLMIINIILLILVGPQTIEPLSFLFQWLVGWQLAIKSLDIISGI